jgi:hypothetical protein
MNKSLVKSKLTDPHLLDHVYIYTQIYIYIINTQIRKKNPLCQVIYSKFWITNQGDLESQVKEIGEGSIKGPRTN